MAQQRLAFFLLRSFFALSEQHLGVAVAASSRKPQLDFEVQEQVLVVQHVLLLA